jgi:hypothetical protein
VNVQSTGFADAGEVADIGDALGEPAVVGGADAGAESNWARLVVPSAFSHASARKPSNDAEAMLIA